MNIAEILRAIGESLSAGATVKSVYGEPVTSGQRVVIPVATIRYGFGGGGGTGSDKSGETPREGGGGGGGGRLVAKPLGVVEVTPEGTRFLHYNGIETLATAVAVGLVAGLAIGACLGWRRGAE